MIKSSGKINYNFFVSIAFHGWKLYKIFVACKALETYALFVRSSNKLWTVLYRPYNQHEKACQVNLHLVPKVVTKVYSHSVDPQKQGAQLHWCINMHKQYAVIIHYFTYGSTANFLFIGPIALMCIKRTAL